MVPSVVVTLLRHGARNVRFGGLPFFFATLMTSLGLFSLAAFATVLLNFERVAASVGDSVAAVCFLDVDDAASAEELRARISLLAGVQAARLVTPEAALVRARRSLGDTGQLLAGTAGVRMPWIVEVTPHLTAGQSREELITRLRGLPGVDEVMHPGGEVARVEALLELLRGAGVFLCLLVGLVVLVVVSNSVKLTVLARRDEIAIMKLVGATDLFVRVPFLLAGLVQGLIGAAGALLALLLAHGALAGVVQLALSGPLGTFVLQPLPPTAAGWVLVGGAFLGVFGSLISVGRFLRV